MTLYLPTIFLGIVQIIAIWNGTMFDAAHTGERQFFSLLFAMYMIGSVLYYKIDKLK